MMCGYHEEHFEIWDSETALGVSVAIINRVGGGPGRGARDMTPRLGRGPAGTTPSGDRPDGQTEG